MTPLEQIISNDIRTNGPMTVSQYMAMCLFHPNHGYYTQSTVFGRGGDFITAPEISQMFGELVGLALAQAWIDAGQPSPSTLLELGPGRGTLMADILRATKRIPGFHAAITITLCEASPKLRDIQQQTLVGYDVTWITDLTQLDDAPLFCVANEFFDALPIRQFQRDGSHWHERTVGLQQDALCFGLSKSPTDLPQLMARLNDTSQGDIVEICQQAVTICDQIGQVINAQGGLALIFDYGDWRSLGDTLQAVQNHAYCDPLQTPGQADITAQVDFEALAQATPSAYSRVTPQGVWLERLGITARAQTLARGLSGDALDHHIQAHRRLTHPNEMGTLFKVMALFPKTAKHPVGFEP